MKTATFATGLIATALLATGCNGAETGGSGVSPSYPGTVGSGTSGSGSSGGASGGVTSSGPLGGSGVDMPKQTCNADAVKWAIGQTATDEVVERARRESGARVVRVIPPGLALTQEFMFGRLNINVDRLNVIQSVSCW